MILVQFWRAAATCVSEVEQGLESDVCPRLEYRKWRVVLRRGVVYVSGLTTESGTVDMHAFKRTVGRVRGLPTNTRLHLRGGFAFCLTAGSVRYP